MIYVHGKTAKRSEYSAVRSAEVLAGEGVRKEGRMLSGGSKMRIKESLWAAYIAGGGDDESREIKGKKDAWEDNARSAGDPHAGPLPIGEGKSLAGAAGGC